MRYGFSPHVAWLQALVVAAASPALTADAASFAVESAVTISHQPEYYHGWPSIGGNGSTLYLVYSGGRDDHVCPFGRIELSVSRDAGRTWSWPRVLQDSPIDDRDPSILVTRRGTILVGSYGSLAYQQHLRAPERRMNRVFGAEAEAKLARWRLAELATTDEEKQRARRSWMMRSTDGGITWSEAYTVPCYSPHGPTELSDGTLFFAGSDGKRSAAWSSRDDGLTWTFLSEIPTIPGETHGVEAADGTLIAQVRNRVTAAAAAAVPGGVEGGGGWAMLQCESHDGGRTWSKARNLGVSGYPSHLLRLKDNSLVMTYGVRRSPQGIRARISRDHGRTWDAEKVLTADGTTDDIGYPATVQVPDGRLVTVWYEVRPPARNAVIRQVTWTPGN